MAPTNRNLRSIQGFNQDQIDDATFMSEGDLDAYLRDAQDGVLVCRERGRHLYPTSRQTDVRFTAITDSGLLVRQVWCESCGLAERREFWETRGRGAQLRYHKVDSTTVYHQGPHGERYLAPSGQGRMTPRMVQSAIMTQALAGQSLASVKASAKAYMDKDSSAAGEAQKKHA